MTQDLYQIADELRALANAGLRWCQNGYDRERYEKALRLSARIVSTQENRSEEDVLAEYNGNLAHLSPVLCVEAAVVRDGKILLIQRADDHTWAIPGGLLEVGESPASGAERELWEEAGVRGRAVRLLGVYDTRFWPSASRMQLCVTLFLMETDDDPMLHIGRNDNSSLAETLAVGFFAPNALPEMHISHDRRVAEIFRMLGEGTQGAYFDR